MTQNKNKQDSTIIPVLRIVSRKKKVKTIIIHKKKFPLLKTLSF